MIEDYAPIHAIIEAATEGWRRSQRGQLAEALAAYRRLDALLPEGRINPEISLLRHNVGRAASGLTTPIRPTEDRVVSFVLPDGTTEAPDDWGMRPLEIDGATLEWNIRKFIAGFEPGHHAKNITNHLPHVLVLSTGRCGTISLLHLFERTDLVPYHTYWWLLSPGTRWEMMCRLMAGEYERDETAKLWAATHAAEWLGAMSEGRPMLGLNHLDTIFAPVFAAIHPQSRFVHLHRDPVAVFESFLSKHQWGESQLRPMFYALSPEFRFRKTAHDLPECIAWYVHFTATFAGALGRVVGPKRYLDVSSDKLFAQDRDEIGRLIEFTGADIRLDDAVEHFATRINEKAHKATMTADEMSEPREAFTQALGRLQQTGRL